jgi:hypothetical protein
MAEAAVAAIVHTTIIANLAQLRVALIANALAVPSWITANSVANLQWTLSLAQIRANIAALRSTRRLRLLGQAPAD